MGGGDGATQTTTNDPWEAAQPYLTEMLQGGQDIFRRQAGQDFTKDYIGLTPEQLASINTLQQYYTPGGQYDALTGQATSAWQNMLRDPTEVAQSQEVKDMIAAMTSPMLTQLNESMLPSVRSGAAGAGQYGSTRQGVAEGVAMGKTQEAIGNATSNTVGNIYQQALQAQLAATGMAPMMTELGAGGSKQLFDLQNLLRTDKQGQADMDYWNRTQSEYTPYQNWMQMLMPLAGQGGTSTTTTQGPQASTGQKVGGAAMTGLGTYAALAGAGIGAATPIGWAAGLAALLGSQ